MARKATDQVTTTGIDISKSSFHLIDLDDRFGSFPAVERSPGGCLELGPKQP